MLEAMVAGSYVAGPATTVQFMVKDSKKYVSTAGWGFAEFAACKPSSEAEQNKCFTCHAPPNTQVYVFTRYAR